MEAPELERRLAAIVAADVEGYSRLMHDDEEATMATLSTRRATIDELILAHRGRIANTAGDSVLAEFASVRDAVFCAVEIQKRMEEANLQENNLPMRLRIGINVGDVMVKDGDIFGDGVNVAARLESLAEGGGICVSRGVHDHLRHHTNFCFEDLGEQLVKNIAHPIRAFRLRPGIAGDDAEQAAEPPMPMAEPASPAAPSPAESTVDAVELAFWDSIKESRAPEELEAYLETYPDGHFASLARARISLAAAEPPEAAPVDPVELAFWEAIGEDHDPRLLAAYLEKYPDGQFAVIARVRLESQGPADVLRMN